MPPELRLFGGVSVLNDGRPVTGAAAQPRRIAVLAVLADACPAPVTRERLIGLLWPEQDEPGARRLLTQAIYELRRELGDIVAPGSGRDVAIDPSALDVDLVHFRRAVAENDANRALALHRAPFLDGFYLRDAGEFERWSTGVRESAVRDLRRVVESAVARHEAAGDLAAAARMAEELVRIAPHDAAAVLRAMSLLERAGDPGTATRVASAYERRMRDDLDLPPDDSVVRRAVRIGEHVPQLASGTPMSSPVVPPAVQQGAAKRRWPMLLPAVAALLAAGIYLFSRSATVPTPVPTTIVVRAFDARGDTEAGVVASRLAPLLIGNLDGAGGMHVVGAGQGTDTASARALSGTVVVTGRTVRIDATLAARDAGAAPYRASVTGAADSIDVLATRVAMDLLPELYPNLDAATRREVVRTLNGVAAARAWLTGESALNRAAFDTAYASLRSATQADSGNAFLWYRRAVAAEEVQHIDDADRSAAYADDRRASLAPREMRLVHAYRVWRTGDVRAADSLYREILRTRPGDAEAWFHFAEVSYHGGPLVGHPLDDARDAWRRTVALDSNNFPALMHAVRLEARAGNDSILRVLLRRAEVVQAREPYLSEARAIAAAAGDRGMRDGEDLRRLDAMPDASLQFVHAIVAGFVERPDFAYVAAVRLIEPRRPDAVRVEGYAALAHLAMSRGQTRLASAMLDTLRERNAAREALVRAYFATLPFLPPDSVRSALAASELAQSPSRPSDAPLYLDLSVDAAVDGIIHRYAAALLDAQRGVVERQSLDCARLPSGAARDMCVDLEHGLAAEMLVRANEPARALGELEAMSMRVPYQLAGRSVYFARTRERFLRAQLLERAGRLQEAYDWYASVPHGARLDYIYLAPTHLGQARIRARLGDSASAAMHYRRAAELLASSDEGAAAMLREARAGMTPSPGTH